MSGRARVALALRLLLLTLTLAGGVGLGFVTQRNWHPGSGWVILMIIVTTCGSILDQAIRLVAKARAPKSREVREALSEALKRAIDLVSNHTGYDHRSIGLTVWRVRGWPGFKYLDRAHTERWFDYPPPSGIRWTAGKGLIGSCWAEKHEQHGDLVALAKRYPHGNGLTQERYLKLKAKDQHMGLSFEEFGEMIGKYGEVFVVPMTTGKGKFLGCVAVDIPVEQCNAATVATKFQTDEVRQVLSAAAVAARRVLKKT
jgi:hypothetical protein